MRKHKFTKCEVMLTQNCNLKCKFCFEKNKHYSNNFNINYNDLKKIIDICNSLQIKYLFLTGGEPLIYNNLIEILKYNKNHKNHPEVAIATNGILLNNKELCYNLIANGVTYLDISLKGKDKNEWISETGYNYIEQQLQGIANISSLNIDFTCSMVITKDSINSICERVKSAYLYGARQFSFTFFIDNMDSQNKDFEYLKINNPFELINNFINKIDELNNITDNWWVEYSFPLCIYTTEQLNLLQGKLASPCHIFTNDAIIFNPNCELLPCDMYNNFKLGKLSADFISPDDLLKLYDTDDYQNILNNLSSLPSESCQKCTYINNCYGGCPVLWKHYSFDSLMQFKNRFFNKLSYI